MIASRLSVILLALIAASICGIVPSAGTEARQVSGGPVSPQAVLAQLAKSGGGLACVTRADCVDAAMELARNPRWVVHVLLPEAGKAQAVRARAAEAGLLGKTLFVEQGSAEHLPHADHLLDLLITGPETPEAEALRVISPIRGRAFIAEKILTKPELIGSDWWTHRVRRADNNPASEDTAFALPAMLQFAAMPFYTAYQGSLLVDGGLRIELYDWLQRYGLGTDRRLLVGRMLARSLYNGQVVWNRELPKTVEPDAQICALHKGRIYLVGDDDCRVLVIDAETGKDLDVIRFPDEADRRVTWIGIENDSLYALLSDWPDPETVGSLMKHTAKVNAYLAARQRGERYEEKKETPNPKRTGAFVCHDLKEGRLVWRHDEKRMINHQNVALHGGRLFFFSEGARLACLDSNGTLVWENKEGAWLEEYRQEWSGRYHNYNLHNMSMMVVGPEGHLAMQRLERRMHIFETASGKLLWSSEKPLYKPTLQGMAFIKSTINGQLDANTGQKLETPFGIRMGGHCGYRAWVPAFEGVLGHLSFYYKSPCAIPPIAAGGVLNYFPSVCNCSFFERGAAGFMANKTILQQVSEKPEHPLFKGIAYGKDLVGSVRMEAGDWPQYRGDARHQGGCVSGVPTTVTLRMAKPLAQSLAVPPGHFQNRWEWLDRATPPVTAGGLAFYGLSTGLLRAVRVSDGIEAWSFWTGGPVYTAPAIADGRLYAGSGDGWVYCLDAANGELIWRWRGAPAERKIMVYDKMVNTWPVMAVLVVDGVVYGNAGFQQINGWSSFALDGKTGQPHWARWHEPIELPEHYSWLDDGFGLVGHPALVGQNLRAGDYALFPGIVDARTGQTPAAEDDTRTTIIAWPGGPDPECIALDSETVLRGGHTLLANPDLRSYKSSASLREYRAESYRAPANKKSKASSRSNMKSQMVLASCPAAPAIVGDCLAVVGGKKDNNTLMVFDRKTLNPSKGTTQEWTEKKALWSQADKALNGVAVCPDAVLALEGTPVVDEVTKIASIEKWMLRAYDRKNGALRWSVDLPCEPALNGVAPGSDGSWVVTLRDGNVAIARRVR